MAINNESMSTRAGKSFWQCPWNWRHALIVQLALIAAAEFLVWRPLPVPALVPPWHWVLAGVGTALVVGVGMVFRRQPWLRWLSGAQFAVTIIILVTVFSLFGVLIVQDPEKKDLLHLWGLRALTTSPPFVAALLLLMVNLATLIGRRLLSPRPGSLGFLLNHVGVLLVFVGAMAGTVQYADPFLRLAEGESGTQAISDDKAATTYDLGGTVTLQKFEIDKFPPKLAAMEMNGGKHKLYTDEGWVAQDRRFRAMGLTVEVTKYLPSAFPGDNGGWVPSEHHGLPAAYLRVTDPQGGVTEQWVTPGIESLGIPPNTATIADRYLVGLLEPQPKAYRSHLTIAEPGHATREVELEVNHPARIGSWILYQSSYDVNMMTGRTSIIQAVRDPSLPVVYLGLACMLLGAFVALWLTPIRRQEEAAVPRQEETQ